MTTVRHLPLFDQNGECDDDDDEDDEHDEAWPITMEAIRKMVLRIASRRRQEGGHLELASPSIGAFVSSITISIRGGTMAASIGSARDLVLGTCLYVHVPSCSRRDSPASRIESRGETSALVGTGAAKSEVSWLKQ